MAALEDVCSSPRPLLCLLALLLLPDLACASRDWDDSEGLAILANETQWQALGAPEHQPLQADYKNEKRTGTPELQGEAAAADPKDLAVVVHALGHMKEARAHGMPLPASAFVRTLAVASAGNFVLSARDMVLSALKSVQTYFDAGGLAGGVLNVVKATHKAATSGFLGNALTLVSWGGILSGGFSLSGAIWDYQDYSKEGNTCLKRVAGVDIGMSILGIATGAVGIACPVVGLVGAGLGLIWDFVADLFKQWCRSGDKTDDLTREVDLKKMDEKEKESLRNLGTKGITEEMGKAVSTHVACDLREPFWNREETIKMYGNKLQQPKTQDVCIKRESTKPKITFTYSDGACPWPEGKR